MPTPAMSLLTTVIRPNRLFGIFVIFDMKRQPKISMGRVIFGKNPIRPHLRGYSGYITGSEDTRTVIRRRASHNCCPPEPTSTYYSLFRSSNSISVHMQQRSLFCFLEKFPESSFALQVTIKMLSQISDCEQIMLRFSRPN